MAKCNQLTALPFKGLIVLVTYLLTYLPTYLQQQHLSHLLWFHHELDLHVQSHITSSDMSTGPFSVTRPTHHDDAKKLNFQNTVY